MAGLVEVPFFFGASPRTSLGDTLLGRYPLSSSLSWSAPRSLILEAVGNFPIPYLQKGAEIQWIAPAAKDPGKCSPALDDYLFLALGSALALCHMPDVKQNVPWGERLGSFRVHQTGSERSFLSNC